MATNDELTSSLPLSKSPYSTRSSRKSLTLTTTDLQPELLQINNSTPTTLTATSSTDRHSSPVSSRTSISTTDPLPELVQSSTTIKMPPKAAPASTKANRETSSVPANQPATEVLGRPSRNRKPTIKAAEMAADVELLPTATTSKQASRNPCAKPADNTSKSTDRRSRASSKASEAPATSKNKRKATEDPEDATNLPPKRRKNETEAIKPAQDTSVAPKNEGKRKADTEEDAQAPSKKLRLTLTNGARSKSTIPAVQTSLTTSPVDQISVAATEAPKKRAAKPKNPAKATTESEISKPKRAPRASSKIPDLDNRISAPASKETTTIVKKASKKRKNEDEAEEEPIAAIEPPKKKMRAAKAASNASEVKKSSRAAIQAPIKAKKKAPVKGKDTKPVKATMTTPKDDTTTTSITETAPTKPRRSLKVTLKLKPTTNSALEGMTRLPCGLKCLNTSDIIYSLALFAAENEELADKIADHTDFESEMGSETKLLRCRYNIVMSEYCICGKSFAVRNGGDNTDREIEDEDVS